MLLLNKQYHYAWLLLVSKTFNLIIMKKVDEDFQTCFKSLDNQAQH